MANDLVINPLRVPTNLISEELEGLYGTQVLSEMREIIEYYRIYEKGAEFNTEGSNGDYIPSDLRFKQASSLVNKEARFLFSRSPDLWVDVPYDETDKEAMQEANTTLQELVDKVLEKNHFKTKLLRAAKDCFIGKRVAYLVNFDEEAQTIKVNFIPSLEFIYETDDDDADTITKIVAFYTVVDSQSKTQQRIYKKKYWMEDDGYCWISEALYDGTGQLVEEITPDRATKFTYIPAGVIVNDGLTGDLLGESEINALQDFESWFSRLSNADIDAERKGMNPVRWARDMNPESTKNLSIAAGAFWDLQTDQNSADGVTGEVGVLETSMTYTNAITSTLNRIKSSMFDSIDMPDVSPEALQGVVSSGKTLKAIYWGLIVRCDEKMLAWRPALENILKFIIEGAKLYPGSAVKYSEDPIPDVLYSVRVDNQYPLPEDETEEKTIDISEVGNQLMSKKAYMKKWRNLTDEEADAELKQIALERELLEDTYGNMGMSGEGSEEEDLEDEDNLDEDEIEDEELDSDLSFENILKDLEDSLNGL